MQPRRKSVLDIGKLARELEQMLYVGERRKLAMSCRPLADFFPDMLTRNFPPELRLCLD